RLHFIACRGRKFAAFWLSARCPNRRKELRIIRSDYRRKVLDHNFRPPQQLCQGGAQRVCEAVVALALGRHGRCSRFSVMCSRSSRPRHRNPVLCARPIFSSISLLTRVFSSSETSFV